MLCSVEFSHASGKKFLRAMLVQYLVKLERAESVTKYDRTIYFTCKVSHFIFKLFRPKPPLSDGSVIVGLFIFSMPRHRNLKIFLSISTMVRLDIRLTVAKYHAIDIRVY